MITSRMPRAEYDAIDAINISRLKELRRSPQHYRYALTHPKTSDAMTLGAATHCAVLEPERFLTQFAIWDRKTDSGRAAPRNGKWWEAFQLEHQGQTILTEDEGKVALEIALAVRNDETAARYLEQGDPEVTLEWEIVGRKAKGRVDWLTSIDGKKHVVGLKTTRDCRHFAFGSQAAKLDYALQWAWYHDGFETITKFKPRMIEIVVESEASHAVAVYVIENDVLLQGRDNYLELLKVLRECEAADEWPGPVQGEQVLTLPSWYYPQNELDDIADLGLEAINV